MEHSSLNAHAIRYKVQFILIWINLLKDSMRQIFLSRDAAIHRLTFCIFISLSVAQFVFLCCRVMA